MEKIDFGKYKWDGKTILIAEDTATSNKYFRAALKHTSLNIIWTENGRDAVNGVINHPELDVVLMDIQMPLMNGIDATRAIKSLKPMLPVIIQTAFLYSNEEELSREAGCDEFLAKPVKLNVLFEVLDKYLNQTGQGPQD
ncbi:MAG: response regulator [Bacteroidales bacterium]